MQEDDVGNVGLYRIQSERPKGRDHFEYLAVYLTIVKRDCKKYGGTFLDALQRLRKATVSVRQSVCMSVRMEQLGSHWTGFCEI
jgi:hypothetical protein